MHGDRHRDRGDEAEADQPGTLLPLPIPRPATLRVVGEGLVTVAADVAQLELVVCSEANSPEDAAATNAAKVQRLMAGLKLALGARTELEGAGYAVRPLSGADPRLVAYRASEILHLRLFEPAWVRPAIDEAVQLGASEARVLGFGLNDPHGFLAAARRSATVHAHARAESMAAALRVRIVGVVSVQDQRRPPTAAWVPGHTDTQPRPVEVRAQVSVTFRVQPIEPAS